MKQSDSIDKSIEELKRKASKFISSNNKIANSSTHLSTHLPRQPIWKKLFTPAAILVAIELVLVIFLLLSKSTIFYSKNTNPDTGDTVKHISLKKLLFVLVVLIGLTSFLIIKKKNFFLNVLL